MERRLKESLEKMEEKRKTKIERLAEDLAQEYFYTTYVDPYSAADDYGIEVRENDYFDNAGVNPYKGVIWCPNGNFVIHLNMKLLGNVNFDEARFTCAHDLGHYFIEEHNQLLRSGQSISFKGNEVFRKSNDPYEQEADLFAANFLLPEQRFKQVSVSAPKGFAGILDLKKEFHTSITCTAFRYVSLGITPSILVIWGNQIWGKEISPQVKAIVGGKPYAILNPQRVLQDQKDVIHLNTGVRYTSGYTLLRNWLAVKGSLRDLVIFEETFHSSKFSLSLITLTNPML